MMKKKHILRTLAVLVALAALAYSATPYGTEDVKNALLLCAKRLVPSIFISVAVSGYLVKSGLYTLLSKPLSLFAKKLFALPEYCAAPILLGFLCGFPNGASAAAELYKCKKLRSDEAAHISAFASLPSLPFFAGFVGLGVFSSVYIGIAIYICCLFSAVCVGAVLPVFRRENTRSAERQDVKISLVKPLSHALSDAVGKTLSASASVVFFSALCGAITHIPSVKRPLCAALCGIFELCGGISKLEYLPLEPAAVLAAALCGFSGLSVYMQVFICAEDAELELSSYIPIKLVIGALSAVFAALLFYLPPAFTSIAFSASFLLCFLLRRTFSSSSQTDKLRQKREARRI